VKEPKPTKEPRPFHSPKIKIVPPHLAFVGRGGIQVGNESTSEYNIGFSGVGSQVPRPELSLDLAWAPMGADHGVYLGASTDFVFAEGGSGWESSGGMLGWRQGVAALDLRVGSSGEPADLPDATALDAVPYAALRGTYTRDLPKFPGGLFVTGEAAIDFIRFPLVDATDMHFALGVGWQLGGELKRSEPKPHLDAVVVAPVEQGPKVFQYKASFSANPGLDVQALPKIPKMDAAELEVLKGEVIRLSEVLRKGLMTSKAPAAMYEIYEQLKAKDYPLSLQVYGYAYTSVKLYGDIQEARKLLLLSKLLAPEDASVDENLTMIDHSYAYVRLAIPKGVLNKDLPDEELVALCGLKYPFAPDQRESVNFALKSLITTGRFEGFLPVEAGVAFSLAPYATEKRTQVFTVQR
jgi:hypothetical protein